MKPANEIPVAGMICNDYGSRVGCKREADSRYTMSFEDIGYPPLYWCSFCGPEAHALGERLEEELRKPVFRQQLTKILDEMLAKETKQ